MILVTQDLAFFASLGSVEIVVKGFASMLSEQDLSGSCRNSFLCSGVGRDSG